MRACLVRENAFAFGREFNLIGARPMLNRELKLVNRLGLHARPSAQIVNLASRFKCSLALICNGRRADARQIVAVMLLAASMGATIKIEANGPDEADAMAAIVQLVNNRFGEAE